jgi:hypothetical protein
MENRGKSLSSLWKAVCCCVPPFKDWIDFYNCFPFTINTLLQRIQLIWTTQNLFTHSSLTPHPLSSLPHSSLVSHTPNTSLLCSLHSSLLLAYALFTHSTLPFRLLYSHYYFLHSSLLTTLYEVFFLFLYQLNNIIFGHHHSARVFIDHDLIICYELQ